MDVCGATIKRTAYERRVMPVEKTAQNRFCQ